MQKITAIMSQQQSSAACLSCQQVAQATAAQQCNQMQQSHQQQSHHQQLNLSGTDKHRRTPSSGGKISYLLAPSTGGESSLSSAESTNYSKQPSAATGSSFLTHQHQPQQHTPSSSLPPALKVKLYELFGQIEKEFEVLYNENMGLQERVDNLTASSNASLSIHSQTNQPSSQPNNMTGSPSTSTLTSANIQGNYCHHDNSFVKQQVPAVTAAAPLPQQQPPKQQSSSRVHKLRTHTNKLRQQTTRIMSNLSKGQSSVLNCTPLRRYTGHRDGVWEVSVSRVGHPIIGTASADHTAIVWGMHSGQALLQYTGHTGSVNSLRFHPNKDLVVTASGDGTVHIWQCAVHLHNESSSGRLASSDDDEIDTQEGGGCGSRIGASSMEDCSVLRTPLRSLTGHQGVVIAADWLPAGDHAVTAGWDRLACIWDTHTGQLVHQLAGHDDELTHTAAHPTQRLVVTSSKDSTFRLWDFRESIHSVSVFQGHQDTVTSAVFSHQEEEKIISGSDDRSVRIWDLRNMRSPVATIQSDSAINRLSVSRTAFPGYPSSIIAIPFDNRNVRLYDMNGQRIGRLPRSSRQQGHSRMVCCTAWSEGGPVDEAKPNLFTCGFDRMTLGWDVHLRSTVRGEEHGPSAKVSTGSTSVPTAGGGAAAAAGENASEDNIVTAGTMTASSTAVTLGQVSCSVGVGSGVTNL